MSVAALSSVAASMLVWVVRPVRELVLDLAVALSWAAVSMPTWVANSVLVWAPAVA